MSGSDLLDERNIAWDCFFLLLFHATFWLVFLVCFDYKMSTIVLHLASALACVILFQYLRCFLLSFALPLSPRLANRLACLLHTTYIFSFFVFYAVNLIANYGWGSHVTLTLLSGSLAHVRSVADSFPKTALLSCGAGVLVLSLLYLHFRRRFRRFSFPVETSESSVRTEKPWSFKGVLVLLLPTVYLALYTLLIARNYSTFDIGIWRSDPIVSLLRHQASGFQPTPLRLAVAALEKKIRTTYPKVEGFQRRNVILITVDGLRPQNMGVYGYERETTPFLSSLVRDGKMRMVEHASSPCPESVCGIMAILTSKDLPRLNHKALGLQHLLNRQGYHSIFLLSGDHRWYDLDGFYEEGIDVFHDGRSDCRFGVNDDRCILEHLSQLERDPSKAYFFNFHLMSAHMVGKQLEEWVRYQPASRARFSFGEKDAGLLLNGYDNGVLQSDYIISKIFGLLEEKGFLADSIVVITADHGEALGEHSLYGHTNHLYEEFIRVPLLFLDPWNSSTDTIASGSLLDIAPTILEILGLPQPKTWMGQAFTENAPSETRAFFHQTRNQNPWRAVTLIESSGTLKLLNNPAKGVSELYNLSVDPKEKDNLFSKTPKQEREQIEKLLRQHFGE